MDHDVDEKFQAFRTAIERRSCEMQDSKSEERKNRKRKRKPKSWNLCLRKYDDKNDGDAGYRSPYLLLAKQTIYL